MTTVFVLHENFGANKIDEVHCVRVDFCVSFNFLLLPFPFILLYFCSISIFLIYMEIFHFRAKSQRSHGSADFFYRVTLCVSAVFAVARCLSVRLSVCHVGGLHPDG